MIGVVSDGLQTIVHPAAAAAPILRVSIARGKFQGVIIRAGPTGFEVTTMRPSPPGATV